MKRVVFFLLLVLTVSQRSNACGPFTRNYRPDEYMMYRVCGDNMKGEYQATDDDRKRSSDNCQLWAQLTSDTLPAADIQQVVYKWKIEQMSALKEAIACGDEGTFASDNRFATWLFEHKDSEIVDFLLLAKKNEKVRKGMNDPWYYATESDDASQELEKLIEQEKAYTGERLKDRYVLQQMRSLFSLKRYNDCIRLWNQSKHCFTADNTLKRMTLGYVGGAEFNLGNKQKALNYFMQIGDLSEAFNCIEGHDKLDYYDWVYSVDANHPDLLRRMQEQINQVERNAFWEPEKKRKVYLNCLAFAERVISDKRCKTMAPWYYTAAFASMQLDRKEAALRYIDLAKKSTCGREMRNVIFVLDAYLDVKYAERYDLALEQRLYKNLLQLDAIMVNNLTETVNKSIACDGLLAHIEGRSVYYWSDMMRRILIGQVVPLCIQSGETTRALQYVNMADNRIFNVVNRVTVEGWRRIGSTWETPLPDLHLTMKGFRLDTTVENYYDYQNDLFVNLDSIGVERVIAFVNRLEQPQDDLDRFLNKGGYPDKQYFYDIIGTQLIAAMRYEEAIPYLEKVSPAFEKATNVYVHFDKDPFGDSNQTLSSQNKLRFAQRMSELRKEIVNSKDLNDRANKMLQFARGLQNSVGDRCWALSSYYWGYYEFMPFYSSYQVNLITNAREKAAKMKRTAFALFTDKQQAAQAYVEWKMFKTAATKYVDTQAGKYVAGHCDVLLDYSLMPDLPPSMRSSND